MQQLWQKRPQQLFFLLVSIFIWLAVSTRWIEESIEQQHPQLWLLSGILLVFGVLMVSEQFLPHQPSWLAHLYFALQMIMILSVLVFYFEIDFFALLFLPLCGQAMFRFERKTAVSWIITLAIATVFGQFNQFGWPTALSFIFLHLAGQIFTVIFSHITLQAQADRARSEQLLTELKTAHAQLQQYADQAEKLAIANERNRLARDLHDSVAQTLYGLTLQAETADRQLGQGNITAVRTNLQQIRDSAQESLQEARLLIFELQPPVLESEGLAAALQTRLDLVERRSGVKVIAKLAQVEGVETAVATAFYRIAQEALNNSLKHAQASEIEITLRQLNGSLCLEIKDNGRGFDPQTAPLGLGLGNMQERAQQIGGRFAIESTSSQGTLIRLEKESDLEF